MTPRVRQAFLTLEDTMNEESCSCESERARDGATQGNLLKRREREREEKRERALAGAIRVISYGCLVETGATLVSINRRPISRHRGGQQGGRALARDRKKRHAEEAYK